MSRPVLFTADLDLSPSGRALLVPKNFLSVRRMKGNEKAGLQGSGS